MTRAAPRANRSTTREKRVAVSRPKQNAKQAKADVYRRLILEAAEKVFAQHGFDAAKIQDIALEAGLSLGTVYSVFPGKTELYAALQTQRGGEVLREIQTAILSCEGVLDRALGGIAAYVWSLVERPHYLHIHLREGLHWTQHQGQRSQDEVAIWERGMSLAVALLDAGISSGFFHGDDPPLVMLKMMIASHQVQLADWLERGAPRDEVQSLIARMQNHFRRAFVRASDPAAHV